MLSLVKFKPVVYEMFKANCLTNGLQTDDRSMTMDVRRSQKVYLELKLQNFTILTSYLRPLVNCA